MPSDSDMISTLPTRMMLFATALAPLWTGVIEGGEAKV
jgi:hypothetical protein